MQDLQANSLLELALSRLLPVLEEKLASGGCPLCPECDGNCSDRARQLLRPRVEALAACWRQGDVGADLAGLIDHTLLKATATAAQVGALCQEALEHRFASVCVNPRYAPLCLEQLQGSRIPVCTVVGFPLGANAVEGKAFEANLAVQSGVREVDMVLAIGDLKAGDDPAVRQDIAAVSAACHAGGAICKVIIETALLTDEEKVRACRLCLQAGADFVKTSTGFAESGATVYDVLLMRHTVGERSGVKAAGGIRSFADACSMLAAGANRLGASAGVQLVREARAFERDTVDS
ncbi:MAG: deoxyribose-phosphate aldolase [Chloroflexia bacterium]|nr:deoxyribose-phosphate aldolase [Chloroflexia bacterium]